MGTPLLRPPLLSAGPARKLSLLLLSGQELFKVMEDQTLKQLLPGADPAGALAPGAAAPPPVPLLWEAEQLDMSEALLTVLSALCSLPPERLPSRGPAACAGRGAGSQEAGGPCGSRCAGAQPLQDSDGILAWDPTVEGSQYPQSYLCGQGASGPGCGDLAGSLLGAHLPAGQVTVIGGEKQVGRHHRSLTGTRPRAAPSPRERAQANCVSPGI